MIVKGEMSGYIPRFIDTEDDCFKRSLLHYTRSLWGKLLNVFRQLQYCTLLTTFCLHQKCCIRYFFPISLVFHFTTFRRAVSSLWILVKSIRGYSNGANIIHDLMYSWLINKSARTFIANRARCVRVRRTGHSSRWRRANDTTTTHARTRAAGRINNSRYVRYVRSVSDWRAAVRHIQ